MDGILLEILRLGTSTELADTTSIMSSIMVEMEVGMAPQIPSMGSFALFAFAL